MRLYQCDTEEEEEERRTKTTTTRDQKKNKNKKNKNKKNKKRAEEEEEEATNAEEVGTPPARSNLCTSQLAFSTAARNTVTNTVPYGEATVEEQLTTRQSMQL